MNKEILNKIKEYDTIIIHRHVSPDPDAMGSQMGLYHLIKDNFPNKNVYPTGVFPEKLSYFRAHSNLKDSVFEGALIIVTDTANSARIDDERWKLGDFVIKIDHHPVDDNYGDINLVNDKMSSTSEMIYNLYLDNSDQLTISLRSQELLLAGIVADTNRFLFPSTTTSTLEVAAKMKEDGVDFKKVYDKLYRRSFNDLRYFGYILNNLEIKNNVGRIILKTEDIKANNTDIATASNLIGELSNVDEFVVWVFVVEDAVYNNYRVNIRSRGPIINDIAAKYGGGGHIYASGLRSRDLNKIYDLLEDLEKRAEEFYE